MSTDKILDKVKKLLALARSDNPNEAALAAATAQRLLLEHGLSMSDLPADEARAGAEVIEEDAIEALQLRELPGWRSRLAVPVARACGCSVLRGIKRVQSVGGAPRRQQQINFIGARADVQTACYLYLWLGSEIDRLARRDGAGRGRGWAGSFRHGAVTTISERLRAERQTVVADLDRQHGDGACTALVRRTEVAVRSWLDQHYPRRTRGASVRLRTDGGYAAGQQAAAAVDIRGGARARIGVAAKQIRG